jgi:hypothetical protein
VLERGAAGAVDWVGAAGATVEVAGGAVVLVGWLVPVLPAVPV